MRTDILTGLNRTTQVIYPLVGPELIVRYHETDIVRVWHDKIVLNTNGWHTHASCRVKLNQVANQFNLPFQVYRTGDKRRKVKSYDGNYYSRGLDRTTGTTWIWWYREWSGVAQGIIEKTDPVEFTDGMEIPKISWFSWGFNR